MSPRWRRGLGIGLLVVLALIVLSIGGVYGVTQSLLDKRYSIQPSPIEIPSDQNLISNGKEIAQFSCAGCHGEDMSGQVLSDSFLDGRAAPSNLTSGQGGIGAAYTNEDWVRAIWHGVDPDGRPLIGMPSDQFVGLESGSLGTLIAYLKSLPPVDNAVPDTTVGLTSRINFTLGIDPLLAAELLDHEDTTGPPELLILPAPTPIEAEE